MGWIKYKYVIEVTAAVMHTLFLFIVISSIKIKDQIFHQIFYHFFYHQIFYHLWQLGLSWVCWSH